MFQSPKDVMRKKAMEMMMKEGPAISMKIAKKPMMKGKLDMMAASAPDMSEMEKMMSGAQDAEEMQEGEPGQEEAGFVQFMVSPEEKAMIEKMRKGGPAGDQGGSEAGAMGQHAKGAGY